MEFYNLEYNYNLTRQRLEVKGLRKIIEKNSSLHSNELLVKMYFY